MAAPVRLELTTHGLTGSLKGVHHLIWVSSSKSKMSQNQSKIKAWGSFEFWESKYFAGARGIFAVICDIAKKFPVANAGICLSKPSSDIPLLPSRKRVERTSLTAENFCVFRRPLPCKVRTWLRQRPTKSTINFFAVRCEAVISEQIFPEPSQNYRGIYEYLR